MIVKTCDKCGCKININLMENTILPIFSVSRLGVDALRWQSVDLCPKCEKELAEWLNNKEESNEREEQDR